MRAQEADGLLRANKSDSNPRNRRVRLYDAQAMNSTLLGSSTLPALELIPVLNDVQDAIRDCERARDLEARAMYSMLRGISL